MVYLTLKFPESSAVIILSVTYEPELMERMKRMNSLLFGIARNPIGTTAFRCARRTVLWMFPSDMYKGWYSIWPVATDTVVLSAPRIIGQ
jgi:hypothetical protein